MVTARAFVYLASGSPRRHSTPQSQEALAPRAPRSCCSDPCRPYCLALAASDELVTASVTGEHGGIAGREIGLLVDPVHLHVFDAASGLNLIH